MNSDSPNTADIVERLNGLAVYTGENRQTCSEAAVEIELLRQALGSLLSLKLAVIHEPGKPFQSLKPVIDKARAALKDHRKAQAHD